jgi:hypothetical protein
MDVITSTDTLYSFRKKHTIENPSSGLKSKMTVF